MPVQAEIAANGSGRIVLRSEYRDKAYVELIPGARWDKDGNVCGVASSWHVPLSWATCKALRGVFPALAIGPALHAWAANELATRVNPAIALRAAVDAPGWGPDGLRPDQRVGVAMLVTGRRILLGDDMGTGKTVMGASAIDLSLRILRGELGTDGDGRDHHPVLVVCPNTVKRGWERELAVWAPNVRTIVVRGSAKQRREALDKVANGEADVAVINWENLRNHSRLSSYGSVALKTCEDCDGTSTRKHTTCERCPRELNAIDWSIVVADECHRAKNPKAKQTRALWAVAHGSDNLVYAWGLTGTPIADAVDDFWSVGHFLAPHEYPTKTKFVDRYGLQSWNAFGGMDVVGIRPETRDEFFSFFDPRFLRRPRQYSLAHIAEPIRTTRFAEMTPKQKKLYRELADEMIGRLDDGDVVMATNPLTQTMRLNQAAASFLEKRDCERCGATGHKPNSHEASPHPDPAFPSFCACSLPLDDPAHRTKCTSCGGHGFIHVPVAPSNKIDDLLSLLDDLPPDEQVVVFAVSRKLIELTAERLDNRPKNQGGPITNCLITGAVNEEQRYKNVDAFRAGEHRVCLVVIDAGGEGLDGLQVAQIGVFMQRHYSMLKNNQAEGRLVRGGQEGQTLLIDIRSEGTIEDDKELILAEKSGRFQEMVRDGDTMRRLLSIRP